MSTLFLVRHGQASFGSADYDVLSPLGVAQARALGIYFARRTPEVHAIYAGPRKRHEDTTEHFLEAARSQGVDYPDPIQLHELDEYPAVELLEHYMPRLFSHDQAFRELVESGGGKDGGGFQLAYEYVVTRWVRGELGVEGTESFAVFRARIRRGLERIIEAQGRSRTIVAFTSGGPISMAMHWALGLTDEAAIQHGWVIGNGSFSEFRYRDARALSLMEFNNRCHLMPDQISYR